MAGRCPPRNGGGGTARSSGCCGRTGGGRRAGSTVVALGLLTCSAVLVEITHGLIEAHFHFFVMVAALSLYEDWVPFLVAVAYVFFEHGLMATVMDHDDVFNHPRSAWKWALVH